MIYLDSGSLFDIAKYAGDPRISGFTTNPTLVKQAGVTNYRSFAKSVLDCIGDKEVSFEVLADTPDEMLKQAMEIASWGPNVFVKIPFYYPDGSTTESLLTRLDHEGVRINVTAVLSQKQGLAVIRLLNGKNHILSIFAGRVMDTGNDARSIIWYLLRQRKQPMRILWASTREVYNAYVAEKVCDIITLPPSIFEKLFTLKGRVLKKYSLETCRQFYEDGKGIEF